LFRIGKRRAARFASKLIGEREIIRQNVSRTSHPRHWVDTMTRSDQHVSNPRFSRPKSSNSPICGGS
jgi:hypothetical protein